MSHLTLSGVSKRFGGVWAVKGVELEVSAGAITGLIGPNGAGKSTIVNLIAGLSKLNSGKISLDGEDIGELAPHIVARKRISRTFQNIRLLNEASVLDNVALGWHEQTGVSILASILGLRSAERARRRAYETATELIERFGMTRHADQLAGQLSYGHQRRVEIMRALAMEPRILLLDEPVAGMNDVEAHSLGEQFTALAKSGLAILLIEHNMQFVMSLCNRIYVLAAGELIAQGTPSEVRADSRVIAAYLGDATCSE
jgi:branched-chain amino acid transport system ATP-binding protein